CAHDCILSCSPSDPINAALYSRGDQIDNYLGAGKRSSFPVDTDKREQFVLDWVPFTGTGRKVADGDFKAGFVGESLEVFLTELQPVPVRSSRVRRNHQSR